MITRVKEDAQAGMRLPVVGSCRRYSLECRTRLRGAWTIRVRVRPYEYSTTPFLEIGKQLDVPSRFHQEFGVASRDMSEVLSSRGNRH